MSIPGNSCCNVRFTNNTCPTRLSGECVYYAGANITGFGINTGDTLDVTINKIASFIVPGTFTSANGLSVFGGNNVLGQNVGNVSNPAILTANREIPMGGFSIGFSGTGNIMMGSTTDDAAHRLQVTGGISSTVLVGTATDTKLVFADTTGGLVLDDGNPIGLYHVEKTVTNNYTLRTVDPILRYKESPTPTTPNNYVVTGNFAVVTGGQTNTATGINSTVIGGTGNIAGGNNSFGVGDNSSCIGGFQNQALGVDSVCVGGGQNVITTGGVGSVIMCGGVNNIDQVNSAIMASGFCTNHGSNSAIIAQNGQGPNPSIVNAGLRNCVIAGGAGHTAQASSTGIIGGQFLIGYSFGEVNVGQLNTSYVAASVSAWNIADRIFNIGIGPSAGNNADALTVMKSGKIGMGISTPSATLNIKAGSATAGTAPIKLTAGPLLTTPEDGTFEYDGTHLYFTIGVTRNTII
jgi:hypothetical protein